jgi:hypothetical protein
MTPSNRDWPEDFELNNGNYFCRCCLCSEQFTGRKRRVICKLCAQAQPAPAEVAQEEAVEVVGEVKVFGGEKLIFMDDPNDLSPGAEFMTVAQHNRIVAALFFANKEPRHDA